MVEEMDSGAPERTPPEDAAPSRVGELEAEVARLTAALGAAERDAATALADAGDLRGLLDASARQAADAASRYREALLRAEPSLPADMLEGETIDELDAALELARSIAGRIDAEARRIAAGATPAGAPERGAPNLAGLSPEQKIRIGLERLG